MMSLLKYLAATGLLLTGCNACLAETIQAHHATVELVSPQGHAIPGHEFWLGIHFSLEKNWHIYWQNPGDSGQPPVFAWQLPAGFTADPVEWPVPEKLKRSSLADYGYQDDVMLLTPIRVAAGVKDGGKADLGLQAKWLICSDVCIPDHAQFHLSLSVSTQSREPANNQSLLGDARKRLPAPWPRTWKASVISEKDRFVLSVVAGKPIQAAEFFPLLPGQIENAAPQPLQVNQHGAKLALKKSDELLKPIHILKGLLVLDGKQAYTLEAPVATAGTKEHNNQPSNKETP